MPGFSDVNVEVVIVQAFRQVATGKVLGANLTLRFSRAKS
jgi:hypothetical protein